MADNKRQHFVPRFYLKRFSDDDRFINIYNIDSCKLIVGGSLRKQCARSYFYGEDLVVEKILGELEDGVSHLFNMIDEYCELPPYAHEYHLLFVLYLAVQVGRTEYATQAIDEHANKVFRRTYADSLTEKGVGTTGIGFGFTEPAQVSLKFTSISYPLLLDMEAKLLINKTSEPFITSDNPAVKFNPYLGFRSWISNTGFACKGLIIYLPIDRYKAVMLHDASTYNVGKNNTRTVDIVSSRDVVGLNALQFCSALNNIYFGEPQVNVTKLHRKCNPYLRKEKINLQTYSSPEKKWFNIKTIILIKY